MHAHTHTLAQEDALAAGGVAYGGGRSFTTMKGQGIIRHHPVSVLMAVMDNTIGRDIDPQVGGWVSVGLSVVVCRGLGLGWFVGCGGEIDRPTDCWAAGPLVSQASPPLAPLLFPPPHNKHTT